MFFRQLVALYLFFQKKIVENPCLSKKSVYLCTPVTAVVGFKIESLKSENIF
jgi:hypothetical protein